MIKVSKGSKRLLRADFQTASRARRCGKGTVLGILERDGVDYNIVLIDY